MASSWRPWTDCQMRILVFFLAAGTKSVLFSGDCDRARTRIGPVTLKRDPFGRNTHYGLLRTVKKDPIPNCYILLSENYEQ